MVAGILAIIGAVFSAICSAVAAVVKVTPWWVYVGFGLVMAGVYLGNGCHAGVPSGCSCRELACGKRPPHVPRAERTHFEHGRVVSVESTNRFTIEQGDRSKRTREVTIRWIVDLGPAGLGTARTLLPVGSPVKIDALGNRFGHTPDGTLETVEGISGTDGRSNVPRDSEEAATLTTDSPGPDDNLGAHRPIHVGEWTLMSHLCPTCIGKGEVEPPPFMSEEYRRTHKWKCAFCEGCPEPGWIVMAYHTPLDDDAMESRSPITGEVKSATGANVGLELVRMGYARASDDAPANYKAAEKAAKGKRK